MRSYANKGTVDFVKNVDITGSLKTTQLSTFKNGIDITGSLNLRAGNSNINGNQTVNGFQQVNGVLGVTGITNLNNNVYVNNGQIQVTNASPGLTLQGAANGSGSAYNITYGYVDNTSDPTNVFSVFGLLDAQTFQGVGTAFNSYTPYYTGSTAMVYGGGNNDDGSDAAIAFPSNGTMDVWKQTKFHKPTVVSSSLAIQSGSLFPNATGSAIVTWNGSTGQLSHTPYSSVLPALFNAGGFYDTGSYTTTANTSGSFVYGSSLGIVDGITISNGSHINVSKAATYNLQFSIQIDNGAGAADVAVWLKKNGSNVADSATYVTVPSNTKQVLALNLWDTANANDYYEIAYQSTTSNTSFSTVAASGNIPRSPAIILTVNQVR
jgi:hypothetical protein